MAITEEQFDKLKMGDKICLKVVSDADCPESCIEDYDGKEGEICMKNPHSCTVDLQDGKYFNFLREGTCKKCANLGAKPAANLDMDALRKALEGVTKWLK